MYLRHDMITRFLRNNETSTSSPTISPTTLAPSLSPTSSPTVDHTLDDFVQGTPALLIAFVCTSVSIVIAGTNIFKHLLNYTNPKLQKIIIRILFMVPFYAAFSFMALWFDQAHVVLVSLRDIYEAFVVYCFLNLMLLYCGGENACVSVISVDPGTIKHVFPFNLCLPEISLTARFLRTCKQGTLQFVFIKPVMAILLLLVSWSGKEKESSWQIFQAIVYNTSYTLALYMLLLFYKATHHHPGLKEQHPILKFLSVKLVVFATYYQSVLVKYYPGKSDETLESLNNFILCCEMVVFAIMQLFAFSWIGFKEQDGTKNPHIASRNDSAFDSIGIDMQTVNSGQQQNGNNHHGGEKSPQSGQDVALQNARDVMSMQDVATDAYYNFSNKYGDHILLDSESDGANLSPNDGERGESFNDFDEKKKKSMFGSLGTKMKSMAGGTSLAGNDDHNPFDFNQQKQQDSLDHQQQQNSDSFDYYRASTPPSMKDSDYYNNEQNDDDNDGTMQKNINNMEDVQPFDPKLPSYLAEKDTEVMQATDNPFAEDVSDPFRLKSSTSIDLNNRNSSFDMEDNNNDYDNNNLDNNKDEWTADFSETNEKKKNKKNKKKKKQQKQKSSNNSEDGSFTELTLN